MRKDGVKKSLDEVFQDWVNIVVMGGSTQEGEAGAIQASEAAFLMRSLNDGANPNRERVDGQFAVTKLVRSGHAKVAAAVIKHKNYNPKRKELIQVVDAIFHLKLPLELKNTLLDLARHKKYTPDSKALNQLVKDAIRLAAKYRHEAQYSDDAKQGKVYFSLIRIFLGNQNFKPTRRLNKSILIAAQNGDYDSVKLCLKKFQSEESRPLCKLNEFFNAKEDVLDFGKKEGFVLHYPVADGRADIVKLMMDVGASPKQTHGDKSKKFLHTTSPIIYAFQLKKEEVILAMLEHPSYKASLEDFRSEVFEYLKRSVKSPSVFFEKIILNLTLLREDNYSIGRALMTFVCEKSNRKYFQTHSPDIVVFAEAYLKIFGSTEKKDDIDIPEGFKKLESCQYNAGKILLELRYEFSNGIPQNLRELVKDREQRARTPQLPAFEHHKKLADSGNVESALIVAEAMRTGKFTGEINLQEAGKYFQMAVTNSGTEEVFSNYRDFVIYYAEQLDVIAQFIQFSEKQGGELRNQCDYVISRLDFDSSTQGLIAGKFSVENLLAAKNPKEELSTRFKLLQQFLEIEHSWQLKLTAYQVGVSLMESAKEPLSTTIKDFLDKALNKNAVVGDLARGLSGPLCRDDSIRVLLSIDTALSRTVLVNYYSARYSTETIDGLTTKLKRDSASLNDCEKLAINKYLALKMYQERESSLFFPRKSAVREQCKLAKQDPEVKALLATLLRDAYGGSDPRDLDNAALYFYEAACQFLELYRYLGREEAYLQKTLENLSQSAKLNYAAAQNLFETLKKDSTLTESEKDQVNKYSLQNQNQRAISSEESVLKIEDFELVDGPAIEDHIMKMLCASEDKVAREHLETAAAVNPIYYTKRILNFVSGKQVVKEAKIMMLECAEAVLSKESSKAQRSNNYAENPAFYLDSVRALLDLLRGDRATAYHNPTSFFKGPPESDRGPGAPPPSFEK